MKKKIGIILTACALVLMSGCQSFQKERDLELYIVGAALTYAGAKHICRTSEHSEKCGVGAAAAFVIWY